VRPGLEGVHQGPVKGFAGAIYYMSYELTYYML